jgi:hypothetical protein
MAPPRKTTVSRQARCASAPRQPGKILDLFAGALTQQKAGMLCESCESRQHGTASQARRGPRRRSADWRGVRS